MSLGAARAGFDVRLAVEIDEIALGTHAKNFPGTAHLQTDVTLVGARQLREAAGVAAGGIAGVIGGPPCQGFSTIGKRDPRDPRNALFLEFFRVVRELRPVFFIAENVPGILSDQFRQVREKAVATLGSDYVLLSPILVKANEYGAPTTRKRVFFIGYRPNALLRELTERDFKPPNAEIVRVRDALRGLPSEISDAWQDFESGCRKVGELPDREFYARVLDRIPRGVGEPNVLRLLRERQIVTGCLGTYHAAHVVRRFRALEPGKKDSVSKALRLDPSGFCPTLRAGTGRDRGSFQSLRPIHHSKPRVITPREAARLQGFPDWFAFHPTKWHSFRQIGNSVSPIVAEHILRSFIRALR